MRLRHSQHAKADLDKQNCLFRTRSKQIPAVDNMDFMENIDTFISCGFQNTEQCFSGFSFLVDK